mmetsp:Transcript_2748/g.6533  ORF Transcript_2748/g.6533 Transcript_2748/m.6533 type:complete len:171 (-) Transcript_2748:114-626(-)
MAGDGPSGSGSGIESGGAGAGAGHSVVELDIKELENACNHLERSNAELAEFLRENGPDADLSRAIKENEEALETKRTRIADLREMLDTGILPTVVPPPQGTNEAMAKTPVELTWAAPATHEAGKGASETVGVIASPDDSASASAGPAAPPSGPGSAPPAIPADDSEGIHL